MAPAKRNSPALTTVLLALASHFAWRDTWVNLPARMWSLRATARLYR
jgi:hypothetical protein